MITDLFFLIIGSVLQILYVPFSALNYALPTQITSSFNTLGSYLNYFNGIFPVDTLLFCITTLITFYIAWYSIKIILFAYALLPFVGKEVSVPTENTINTINLRSSTKGRILDLRQKQKGKIGMKDIR